MSELSQQALDLIAKRYLREGENTWSDICHRVAKFLANNEGEYDAFYYLMNERVLIPNTPCLANAGTDYPMLSACFLLPIEDSIESIFNTLRDASKVFQKGGGVGFNFTSLRPEGSAVGKSHGVASGPISFMKVYDAAINELKQGGLRRGAAMGLLMVDHPDIVKFIRCKHIDKQISNFNISVGMTDEFMSHLDPDSNSYMMPWRTRFGDQEYYIYKHNNTPVPVVAKHGLDQLYSAKEIWDLLCEQAWTNGEPGLIFMDEIWKKNGPDIKGVNPCGEVSLEDYGACVLASIDVGKLDTNLTYRKCHLEEIIETGTILLNRIVDKGVFPLEQITKTVQASRKIGLGMMGFAEFLLKRKIPYDSSKAREEAYNLQSTFTKISHAVSSVYNLKNTETTVQAPTGSLSIIAGCTGGIEPVYKWITSHHRKDFDDVVVVHPLVTEYFKNKGIDGIISEELLGKLPDYFVTATQVSPKDHVLMQASFQGALDLNISKTVNLPENATIEDVRDTYKLAWDMHCKGITVYREGSREDQVLTDATKPKDGLEQYIAERDAKEPGFAKMVEEAEERLENTPLSYEELRSSLGLPEERPYCMDGFTFKIRLDLGGKVENTYITVNVYDGLPYEVFLHGNVREVDPLVAQYIDTITRLVSLSLQGGIPLVKVITQLERVPCSHIYSIPHKIAHVLREFLMDEDLPETPTAPVVEAIVGPGPVKTANGCPDCGGKLIRSEGCVKCSRCAYSKCS